MPEESKTKEELNLEVATLRQRVAELERMEGERQRIETALRESEKKYKQVVENAAEIIYATDAKGNFTYGNSAGLKITGYSLEELQRFNYLDLVLPEHRQRLINTYIGQLRQRQSTSYVEFPFLSKSGKVIWFGQNASLVIEGGEVAGFHVIARDITERKQAEEALRESEERHRLLFESSHDAIMVLAPFSGKFTRANPATLKLFGAASEDEFTSLTPHDISPERQPDGRPSDQKAQEMIETALRNGSHYFEWTHKRFSGKEFHATVLLTRMELAGQTLIQATVRDITEQKRAEEVLHESEKAAQQLAQENAVMAEIGRIIGSTLNIEAVYERFAEEARKLLPFDRIVVSLNNPEAGTATVSYASGLQLGGRTIGDAYPLHHTSNEEVIRTRAGLLIQVESVEELEGRFSGLIPAFRAGLRSIITVPLIFRDRVIGALRLASKEPNAYTDRDLKLAERIGAHIAGAIANAQLYIQRERTAESLRRSEEAARRLAQETAVIAQIGRIISSTLDIDAIYERFAREANKLIEFDRVSVGIIDRKENQIILPYVWGAVIPGRQSGDIIPLSGSLSEDIFKTHSTLLIQTEDEKEFATQFPTELPIIQAGLRSTLFIPLIVQDEVIGNLSFFSKKSNAYTDHDVKLAESIGYQVAGAIANAHLFLERKRADEALREQQQLLDNILNSVPVPIFYKDIRGNYLGCNSAYVDFSGLPRERVIGKTVCGIYSAEMAEIYLKADQDLIQNGGNQVYEANFPHADHTVREVMIHKAVFRNTEGSISGVVGVIFDITERKRAEKALGESEKAAKQLAQENALVAEIGQIISSTLNTEEVYERFAEEACKLIPFDRLSVNLINLKVNTLLVAYTTGMDVKERRVNDVYPIKGTVTEETMRTRSGFLIQPEGQEEFEAQFPALIPPFQAGIRSMMSVPLISRDVVIGALHFRLKKSKAYTDQDLKRAERIAAQIAGAMANAQLFNELKQAEDRLKRSEEHFRLLIESSSDVITQIDHQQNICYASPSVERVLGYKPEDYIGQNIFQFIHPDDLKSTTAAFIQGLQEIGRAISIEHRLKHKNGSWPFFQTVGRGILDESGNRLVVANSRDITERKNLESQLVQAQKLESIGQLAAGIAHEINTPTQYVGDNTRFFNDAFNDLLRLMGKYDQLFQTIKNGAPLDGALQEIEGIVKEIDLAYLTDEIPKAIRQTLEGVERVRVIVQAMKEFSHPGTKEKTPINLNKAIQNTITVARNEWKYVAEMASDFDPSLPLVSGLPGELNQVILNMIINAAHAIADVVGDGSKGKGTITLSTRQDGNWAEIRVSDTGTGIPENIRSRVFDPFFTTKKVGKGTGQGLTISHSVIVDKHGGTIHFDTEMGKGTTFIIRLPIDGAGL